MARKFYRKLIDPKGHIYAVEIPHDCDPESLEEILIASQEGIIKLQGYLLEGEANYRSPSDNQEILNSKKIYSFYKRIEVPVEKAEEFREVMSHLIEESKKSRINKVKVTEFEGKKILRDERGYYINWSVPCHICGTSIDGIKRLSMNDGVFTRAQAFLPFDHLVQQYRPGSKLRTCGSCSPVSLTPSEANLPFPTVEEVKVEALKEAVEAEKEVVKAKVTREKDFTDELLALLDPKSTVDPLFIKGAMFWYLKSQKK